jgi:hypothetical protein
MNPISNLLARYLGRVLMAYDNDADDFSISPVGDCNDCRLSNGTMIRYDVLDLDRKQVFTATYYYI